MAFPVSDFAANAKGKVSRRWFVSVVATGAAALTFPLPARAQLGVISPEALDAFLEIILPTHPTAPPASALNLGAAVLMDAQDKPLLLRLLIDGVAFLDTVGPAPFARLPSATQSQLVAWMAASDAGKMPAQFYHAMRSAALKFYYTNPAATASFDLKTAPQPQGYPPPWDMTVQTAQDQTGLGMAGPNR